MTEAFSFSVVIIVRMDECVQRMDGLLSARRNVSLSILGTLRIWVFCLYCQPALFVIVLCP
jgi:hypothetical protein